MRARFLPLALAALAAPFPGSAQRVHENLHVLPEDISRDSLDAVMRAFTDALGVRCGDCHVMGENGGFDGAQFERDDKDMKLVAREMLLMVRDINERVAAMPRLAGEPLEVSCKTCHRGLSKPFTLRAELRRVIDEEGVEAAVERYRQLRAERMELGAYDFRPGELMDLADDLAAEDRLAEAAAILELDEEFHPRAAGIPRALGAVYERLGRTEHAIAAYRRAVGMQPRDRRSLERLQALTGGGG